MPLDCQIGQLSTASVAETTGYTYDANGSQLTKTTLDGTETRGYNGLGQLVSVTGIGTPATYAYRPDGLRYSKIVGTGANATTHIHLWDGQNIVAEVGVNGAVNSRYLRGINLVAREIDGAKQYYMFNAHGDIVHRVDETANVLKTYQYDAFGNELGMEPLDTNPFRYCGEYFDKETGEIYLRARYYSPATGRFGAEDSARNGLNWYTYCGNSPIMLYDPTGCYYIIQEENSYRVQQDYSAMFYAGIALQFAPIVGGLVWNEPQNVVGGTSHGLESMFSNDMWSIANTITDVGGLFGELTSKKFENLGTVGTAFGVVNALDFISVKGPVAQTDDILFALNKFYGLPTTFSSAAAAENQMSMLSDIYASDRGYFEGQGGAFEGSQFQADIKLHRIKNQRTLGRMLMQQELGMSFYDIMAAEQKNKSLTVSYLRRSNYAKRTAKLWSSLNRRMKK